MLKVKGTETVYIDDFLKKKKPPGSAFPDREGRFTGFFLAGSARQGETRYSAKARAPSDRAFRFTS